MCADQHRGCLAVPAHNFPRLVDQNERYLAGQTVDNPNGQINSVTKRGPSNPAID